MTGNALNVCTLASEQEGDVTIGDTQNDCSRRQKLIALCTGNGLDNG